MLSLHSFVPAAPCQGTKNISTERFQNVVPGSKAAQAKIGSATLPNAGSTEKKAITLTFVIALNGAFLPLLLKLYLPSD